MPSGEFFSFMNAALTRLTALLGSQDGTLHIVPGKMAVPFERRIILGNQAGELPIELDRVPPERCATLSWKNRKGATIPPCVLADASMQIISQYLSQVDVNILEQNLQEWFPYGFGDGFHTPNTLAWELYNDISAKVEGQYEYITQIDFGLVSSLLDMTYESESLVGQLGFFLHDMPDKMKENMTANFHQELNFCEDELRQIRKLLAGAGDDLLVFTYDGNRKNYICKGYMQRTKDVPVRIEFKCGGWVLHYNGRALFKACAAHQLKVVESPLQVVYGALEKEFGAEVRCAFETGDNGSPILPAFLEQSHGSSLIFLDLEQNYSKEWIHALVDNFRAFPVDGLNPDAKKYIDEKRLTALGRMDGAYIVDTNTKEISHLSVIVDGLAIVKGLLDAGARRNSLLMWVTNLIALFLMQSGKDVRINTRPKVVAVAFSEDGTISTFTGGDALTLFPHDCMGNLDFNRVHHPLFQELIPKECGVALAR